MKKYLFNPQDIFNGILLKIIVNMLTIFLLVWDIYSFLHGNESKVVFVLCLICMVSALIIEELLYIRSLKKYGGHFYFENDIFTLKKGEKQVSFSVSDIRFIEMTPYTRSGMYNRGKVKKEWKFGIRLLNQKKNLDFFISNPKMFDIIKEKRIRILPDYLHERIYVKLDDSDVYFYKKRKTGKRKP